MKTLGACLSRFAFRAICAGILAVMAAIATFHLHCNLVMRKCELIILNFNNQNVLWSGGPFGISPEFGGRDSERFEQAFQYFAAHLRIAHEILLNSLRDGDKFVVAHIFMTRLNFPDYIYSGSPAIWNNYIPSAGGLQQQEYLYDLWVKCWKKGGMYRINPVVLHSYIEYQYAIEKTKSSTAVPDKK